MARRGFAVAAAALFLLAGAQSGEAGWGQNKRPEAWVVGNSKDRTSAEEIRRRIIGNSMTGRFADGRAWTEYYAPDGTIHGIYRNRPYSGRWRLRGSSMCFDYEGREADWCAELIIDNDRVLFLQNDIVATHLIDTRILEGSPSGL